MQAAATAAARQQESVRKHTCADSLSHLSREPLKTRSDLVRQFWRKGQSAMWLWSLLRRSPVPSGQLQSDVDAVVWTKPVEDAWHPSPASGGISSTKRRRTSPSAMTLIATRSKLCAAVVTTCENMVKCKAMPEIVMLYESNPVACAAAVSGVTFEERFWLQLGRRARRCRDPHQVRGDSAPRRAGCDLRGSGVDNFDTSSAATSGERCCVERRQICSLQTS